MEFLDLYCGDNMVSICFNTFGPYAVLNKSTSVNMSNRCCNTEMERKVVCMSSITACDVDGWILYSNGLLSMSNKGSVTTWDIKEQCKRETLICPIIPIKYHINRNYLGENLSYAVLNAHRNIDTELIISCSENICSVLDNINKYIETSLLSFKDNFGDISDNEVGYKEKAICRRSLLVNLIDIDEKLTTLTTPNNK